VAWPAEEARLIRLQDPVGLVASAIASNAACITRWREPAKRLLLWDVGFGKFATLSTLVSNDFHLRLLCHDLMRCCTSAALLAWLDWFVARGKVRQPSWLVPDVEGPMTGAYEVLQTCAFSRSGCCVDCLEIGKLPMRTGWPGMEVGKLFRMMLVSGLHGRNDFPRTFRSYLSPAEMFLEMVGIPVSTLESSSHLDLLTLELPAYVNSRIPSRVKYQARHTAEFSTVNFVPDWCL